MILIPKDETVKLVKIQRVEDGRVWYYSTENKKNGVSSVEQFCERFNYIEVRV